MMKLEIKSLIAGLGVIATLMLSTPALADDTLDRGIGSEWSSLDPQVNFGASAGWILGDAYEGLVNFDATGQLIPGAAESWEASEDGKTYTFHLRDGLKWSNGEPLVAQDYVNGIKRTLDPATASEKGYYFYSTIQIKGASEIANAETTDMSGLGVTAPDTRTVVVEMLTPAPFIMDLMGSFQMAPLHSPSFDAHGTDAFIDPEFIVSNGAYVIKEIVPQSHVLLERNPNYWDAGSVQIPFVKYHVTEDVNTELKRYQAGEIDITNDIPIAQMDKLLTKTPDEVLTFASTYLIYYSFNLSVPPFDNIDVRRALTLAIDRDTLEGKIVRGGAVPTYSYGGGFDPDYKGPQIAEAGMTQAERETLAQELMLKAGYGPDNPLKLSIASTVAEVNVRRANGIALMWKKVLGVEAENNGQEFAAWLDLFYTDDWSVFADNLVGDFAGPETFLAYMRPSSEPGYGWEMPSYDAAMDAAAAIPDQAGRYEALAVAEKILLDDYIMAPIAIEPYRHLVKPNVKGFKASVAGAHNSQFITFE
jgi:oligopeptide transport system substrate-binding protein